MIEFFLWFTIFWFWHGWGVTVGYHRALTHKAVDIKKPVLYLLIFGGYLAMQGSPIGWAAVHRIHHQTVDTSKDPHTPMKGFFRAFLEWIWINDITESKIHKHCKDLIKEYPLLCEFGLGDFPGRPWYCLTWCILWRLLLLAYLGPACALASFLAWWVIFFAPMLVNTFCHLEAFGYRTFRTKDESRNVPWVAALTFGEGWHNNHHAFPKAAKSGFLKSEFDSSYILIKGLEKLGLAKRIRE